MILWNKTFWVHFVFVSLSLILIVTLVRLKSKMFSTDNYSVPVLSIIITLTKTIIRLYLWQLSLITETQTCLLMLTVVIIKKHFFSGGDRSNYPDKKIAASFINPAVYRCRTFSLVLK